MSAGEESTLNWAIAATAFFGFFRLGELLVVSPSGQPLLGQHRG